MHNNFGENEKKMPWNIILFILGVVLLFIYSWWMLIITNYGIGWVDVIITIFLMLSLIMGLRERRAAGKLGWFTATGFLIAFTIVFYIKYLPIQATFVIILKIIGLLLTTIVGYKITKKSF